MFFNDKICTYIITLIHVILYFLMSRKITNFTLKKKKLNVINLIDVLKNKCIIKMSFMEACSIKVIENKT